MAYTSDHTKEDTFVIDAKEYFECICYPQECDYFDDDYDYFVKLNFSDHYFLNSSEYDFGINCERGELSHAAEICLICLYTSTILFTLVGNAIVILVLTLGARTKTTLNKYLINLAVADMALAIFAMPFTFVYALMKHWIFSEFMCPFVLFIQQVSAFVSIATLAAIAVDRYTAIVDPLKKMSSNSRPAVVIAIVWGVSIGLGCVQLVKVRAKQKVNDNGSVTMQCDEWWGSDRDAIIYESYIYILTYLVPLTILVYTYRRITYLLSHRQLPGVCRYKGSSSQDAHIKAKVKVVKMLSIVVLAFGLCWLPLATLQFVLAIYPQYLRDYYYREYIVPVYLTSHWLAMANSFLNPILYTCLHESFRNDLTQLLHNCRIYRSAIRKRMNSTNRRQRRRRYSAQSNLTLTLSISSIRNAHISTNVPQHIVIKQNDI